MYESITYSELKKLPKDQKSNAWKELSALCSTKKELALKLGVSPAVVYNMISKYVEGKPIGKRKNGKQEVVVETKKVRGRHKKVKMPEMTGESVNGTGDIKLIAPVTEVAEDLSVNDSFSIAIKKTVRGEDAQFFLNGIGGTLLKNQKYVIEVKITEK